MSADSSLDALGLRGILPCPGWMVLDQARDHRFTGELVAEADTVFTVYFDRGRIYVAEREHDPWLGDRLVEAGALNAAQLEHGTLRVGHIRHLGRLFDRVPTVNRDGVMVLNELMTDECVRSLARQRVAGVRVTPYRHHESGMHRWDPAEPAAPHGGAGEVPDMALPAPPPDSQPMPEPTADATATGTRAAPTGADLTDARPSDTEPTATGSPAAVAGESQPAGPASTHGQPADTELTDTGAAEPATSHDDASDRDDEQPDEPGGMSSMFYVDDVVEWHEPSMLDDRAPGVRSGRRAPRDLFADGESAGDWVDRLGDADVGVEPGATRVQLAPVVVKPADQFELVWPSGETVDLAEGPAAAPAADLDLLATTARVATAESAPISEDHRSVEPPPVSESHDAIGTTAPAEHPIADDEVTLAVRRAVLTIDTGSLEARRRLASNDAIALPGRVAVHRELQWRSNGDRPSTSVFDDAPAPAEPAPEPEPELAAAVVAPPSTAHQSRTGALRRLIDGLRRA